MRGRIWASLCTNRKNSMTPSNNLRTFFSTTPTTQSPGTMPSYCGIGSLSRNNSIQPQMDTDERRWKQAKTMDRTCELIPFLVRIARFHYSKTKAHAESVWFKARPHPGPLPGERAGVRADVSLITSRANDAVSNWKWYQSPNGGRTLDG